MKFYYAQKFKNKLKLLPREIQKKMHKQARHLSFDLRHPSLRAKKYDETRGIWQARVDRNNRFYFLMENDMYIFLDIGPHPK
jgi:mRNA interferase RelE/StbE